MRMVSLLTLISAACVTPPIWSEEAFGIWKANLIRSTNSYAQGLVVRFERHPRGEVFTVDRVEKDRVTTSSTILYLDGKEREFQGFECSGTQSSRRLDGHTVEILRTCATGESTRFVRRLSTRNEELILEITEEQPGGHRFERRLVMEKQHRAGTAEPK
jgi:hypothetical protein